MSLEALGLYKVFFLVVIVLIILDVIFGIVSAIKHNTFSAQRMVEFLSKDVLPCVLGLATFILFVYFVMPSVGGVSAALLSEIVSVIAFVMVGIFLVFSIIKSANEIFTPAPARA
jgi:hypothetical protein